MNVRCCRVITIGIVSHYGVHHGNMFRSSVAASRKQISITIVAAAFCVSGVFVSSSVTTASAAELEPIDDPGCSRHTNSNGNVVLDMDSCLATNYIPDVAGADAESQRMAFEMFKKTMKFCATDPTGVQLRAGGWAPITEDVDYAHWESDSVEAKLGPPPYANADVVISNSDQPHGAVSMGFTGKTIQILWGSFDFPYLGTIIHAHNHAGHDWEMLHINCRPTIEEMFEFTLSPSTVPEDPSVFTEALRKAETGGIAAVSSQIAARGGDKISGIASALPSQLDVPSPASVVASTPTAVTPTGTNPSVGSNRTGTITAAPASSTAGPRVAPAGREGSTTPAAQRRKGRIIPGSPDGSLPSSSRLNDGLSGTR